MAHDMVRPWIRELAPYLPGKTIEGKVKLASNENNYGPSPQVINGLREAAPKVYLYPHKDRKVTEAIGEYCGEQPENLVVGSGSDELIDLTVKAFKGPVGSHYPTFVQYPAYPKMLGEKYIRSNLNQDYSFDAERFIKETEEANLLFLCTPNNPTGTIIEPAEVEVVVQTGKVVVVDEAYYEFWGKTCQGLVQDYDNVIILRTMAKAFGLAGLRIGYAIASEEVAAALRKVKPPFDVNNLAQEAAILALKDIDYMRETVGKIMKDRERLAKKLAEKYRVVPSQTNFVLVDVSPETADGFYERMLKAGFVVRNIGSFTGFDGNWIRITVGTKKETDRLLQVL